MRSEIIRCDFTFHEASYTWIQPHDKFQSSHCKSSERVHPEIQQKDPEKNGTPRNCTIKQWKRKATPSSNATRVLQEPTSVATCRPCSAFQELLQSNPLSQKQKTCDFVKKRSPLSRLWTRWFYIFLGEIEINCSLVGRMGIIGVFLMFLPFLFQHVTSAYTEIDRVRYWCWKLR